ncbi:hypothetical protein [Cecembia rubra]|uniref:hypothetical protein n=1 Tax=Cecembia rubra TaxID=1485585 RepID=UPI0027150448|nr:hypothetical protein [Cecembia rubra]
MKNKSIIAFIITFFALIFSCQDRDGFPGEISFNDSKVFFDNDIKEQISLIMDGTKLPLDKSLFKQLLLEDNQFEDNLLDFNMFELISSNENDQSFYFLKAISDDGSVETGYFLEEDGNGGFLLSEKKCSCTGCPNGCNLSVFGGTCSRTPCWPSGENQKCEKKEEQTIK